MLAEGVASVEPADSFPPLIREVTGLPLRVKAAVVVVVAAAISGFSGRYINPVEALFNLQPLTGCTAAARRDVGEGCGEEGLSRLLRVIKIISLVHFALCMRMRPARTFVYIRDHNRELSADYPPRGLARWAPRVAESLNPEETRRVARGRRLQGEFYSPRLSQKQRRRARGKIARN